MVDAYNLDVSDQQTCYSIAAMCIFIIPIILFFACVLRKCFSFPQQSKLEKADVLEITVQHMENLQRGPGAG